MTDNTRADFETTGRNDMFLILVLSLIVSLAWSDESYGQGWVPVFCSGCEPPVWNAKGPWASPEDAIPDAQADCERWEHWSCVLGGANCFGAEIYPAVPDDLGTYWRTGVCLATGIYAEAWWVGWHKSNTDDVCPGEQVVNRAVGYGCITPEDLAALEAPASDCPKQPTQVTKLNPCDPATGNKSQVEVDFAPSAVGTPSFNRYYNSKGAYKTGLGMGAGWRHTYSRALDEEPDQKPTLFFTAPANQSSFYTSVSDACTNGWDDIKATVLSGDLAAATPTFAGGNVCKLTMVGSTVAYLPVRTGGKPAGFSAPATVKTVTRPQGANLIFELVGSDWVNQLNPTVTLEQSGGNWILTDGNDTRETYNAAGKLTAITYRNGQTETLEYNLSIAQGGDGDSSTLDRVTGPFGHSMTLSYDANGQLGSVTTADGVIQYAYDAEDNLSSVTYPDNTIRQYVFEETDLPNHLTGILDENGDRFATWDYDDAGRAILSEHAGGKERGQLTYNTDGTTTVTMANGATRTYTYTTEQGQRRLSSLSGDVCGTCPAGNIKTRSYDSNGFVDQVTDWNDNVTMLTRNGRGLIESLTEAFGASEQRVTSTLWHADYRLPTKVTAPHNVTDYTYDANGNVLTITISGGTNTRAWTFTYNAQGQPLTIDGPRTGVSDVTTIEYYECTTGNECGQIKSVTNALGHATSYDTYDAAGRLTQMTDPNGLQTSFTYDNRGRLLTTAQTPVVGAARAATMTYDDVGQLATLSLPDGIVLTYAYSAAHYLASVTDNLGKYITYDYDAMGNPRDENTYDPSNALTRALEFYHDLNYRLDTVTNGGFSSNLDFDLVGNLTSETDPNNVTTQHTYDALNRLDSTIDALTGVIDYTYDDSDNLTLVTAPNGASTSYIYDELDNLESETSPDRGLLSYTYDDAGNRVTETDARGKLTTYSYDALNRLSQITLDGGGTIVYEYDTGGNAKGRLNKITDSSGNTAWTYDKFGAVSQKTQTIGTVALSTQYGYDADGRLTSMTLPSGKVVTYGYNVFQPNSVTVDSTPILSGATYDPFGPVNSWIWGNSSTNTRAYDLRGLIANQTLGPDNRNLLYDPAGQITSMADGSHGLEISYDPLGRLTSFEAWDTSGSNWLALATVGAPDTVFLQSVTVTPGNFDWTPTMPTTPGDYEFRLFEAGGFNRIATSATVTVSSSPPPPTGANITISASLANGGDPVTAVMTGGPGNTYDWLALASVGAANGSYVQYTYVAAGATSANWQVNMPSTAGDYEFRLFENNGYTRLATSTAVTIAGSSGGSSATIDVSAEVINGGESVTANMSGGPGNASDWIALATVGSPVSSYINYVYVPSGSTSATWTINIPTAPNEYEFRLFANNGYTLLATSDTVTVPSGGPPTVEVSATAVSAGDTLTVSVPATVGTASGILPASQSFTYDANGNRLTLTEDGNSYSYSNQANSNQLLSTTGPTAKTYAYDAAGNIVSDGVHTYGYDDRGRLVTVDASTATYQHNGQGQRVKKDNGTVTLFVYGESGQLNGEYDSLGNAIKEHVWFNGAPVAVLSGTDVHYVHTDHLGTPRVVTEGNTVIWRWESDPFGSTGAQEDPDGDSTLVTYNLRFPGQYYDSETGLHYNYFRTYDPTLGMYVHSDPIGLKGGSNTYSYVGANPLYWIDPMGLDVMLCKAPANIAYGLIDHHWLKTDTLERGMGGDVENPGEEYESLYVVKVTVTDHSGQSVSRDGASCEVVDADEDKVNELLQLGRPLGRFTATNNCQTFAKDVLFEARTPEQIEWDAAIEEVIRHHNGLQK